MVSLACARGLDCGLGASLPLRLVALGRKARKRNPAGYMEETLGNNRRLRDMIWGRKDWLFRAYGVEEKALLSGTCFAAEVLSSVLSEERKRWRVCRLSQHNSTSFPQSTYT